MKKEIEKLHEFSKEVWTFCESIGMIGKWDDIGPNLRIYFDNNYRTKSIQIGPNDNSGQVEISNYIGDGGAIRFPLKFSEESLRHILELGTKSFDGFKEKDHAQMLELKEKNRQARVKELEKELNYLTSENTTP